MNIVFIYKVNSLKNFTTVFQEISSCQKTNCIFAGLNLHIQHLLCRIEITSWLGVTFNSAVNHIVEQIPNYI